MAGILCAYQLHCAGVLYVLVEAETICSGITKNTTAKIISQHGLIHDKLISRLGVEQATPYLAANEAALHPYRKLCQNIDCDFEEKPAYAYLWTTNAKLSGSGQIPSAAQFHSLKFVSGIAAEDQITRI